MAEHSNERDLDRARRVAEDGLILRTTVGSVVHGLSNPGTDDRDEMGVTVEPPEYVIGNRAFDHYIFRTQPEGHPSGPGDLDLSVYGLKRYCHLALKGSPTTLLPLFVTGGEHLLHRTSAGERLQALAPTFVAKRTGRAFLGYLESQRKSLLGAPQATRTRELSAAHGYDTKYAMHALRIGIQGIELLEHGRITLPVPEPARADLRAVRAGEVPLDGVLERLDEITRALERTTERADLPKLPDAEGVDAFLVETYRDAWATAA